MDRKLLFVVLVFSLIFIISCKPTSIEESSKVDQPLKEELPSEKEETSKEGLIKGEKEDKVSCEVNADCEGGLLCIDGKCGTVAELYDTECENKCTTSSVTVLTSDDETYTLNLGQGSYSYAGALEWKLMVTPNYCKGGDPLVAIKIIKKTSGKVLSEQVLTLHKGETSDVINHSTVKRVQFKATLSDVVEDCS